MPDKTYPIGPLGQSTLSLEIIDLPAGPRLAIHRADGGLVHITPDEARHLSEVLMLALAELAQNSKLRIVTE